MLSETVGTLKNALSVEAPGRNFIREAWDKLVGIPGGKRAFSFLVGRAARYTATINPRVLEVRQGYARVSMADTPGVRNPFRSVHAVALTNLAELAGNLAVAYSLPVDARFIVAGFTVEFHKKARGTIVAEGEASAITSSEKREYAIPVTMKDKAGDVVATATLRTMVGPKKS